MFVIYNDETTRTHRSKTRKESWETERAAKAERTRAKLDPTVWIVESETYFVARVELKVRKRNMHSGSWFSITVNTPAYLDPSTETYWSV